jgi:hypothetical protein
LIEQKRRFPGDKKMGERLVQLPRLPDGFQAGSMRPCTVMRRLARRVGRRHAIIEPLTAEPRCLADCAG